MPTFDASALDYVIIAIYFVTVLGVGFLARSLIKTDLDFFLSGRSLPAWITGLAFIAANLGALEILGMAANDSALKRCASLPFRRRRYSGTERIFEP